MERNGCLKREDVAAVRMACKGKQGIKEMLPAKSKFSPGITSLLEVFICNPGHKRSYMCDVKISPCFKVTFQHIKRPQVD